MSIDAEATSNKAICYGCIGEKYLSSIVSRGGKRRTCGYCGKSRKSILIEEMADRNKKHLNSTIAEAQISQIRINMRCSQIKS